MSTSCVLYLLTVSADTVIPFHQQNIYSNQEKLLGRSEQLFKIPIGLHPDSNQGRFQNMQTRIRNNGLKKTTNNLRTTKDVTRYFVSVSEWISIDLAFLGTGAALAIGIRILLPRNYQELTLTTRTLNLTLTLKKCFCINVNLDMIRLEI
jgi:hypothetical protein